MKISIIIPAYNEAATIQNVIERVLLIELPSSPAKEILVVNDGSTDDTAKVLERYTGHPLVQVFHQSRNAGKTKALIKGMQSATGDILLIQDADLEYDPADYPKLLSPILNGTSPIVYGSRFKGSIKGMTFINRMSNIFSNISFNLLYGVHLTDINTCFKVFRKEMLEGITIVSDNFTFETEITAKFINRGYRILEVPIHYHGRSGKEGKKIRWHSALEMYLGMIKFKGRV